MKLKIDNLLLSGLLLAFFVLSAFSIVADIREHASEGPTEFPVVEWDAGDGRCSGVSPS